MTMSSLRSVLKQSPAIAISAAALLFAAGTGVSFATTSTHSASDTKAEHASATTLTWHRLPLAKGWRGIDKGVRYAVSNVVVYLSGWANAPRHYRGDWMARLPRGARPTSSQQDIPVVISGDIGFIQLLHDGRIYPAAPKAEDPFGVSLSGISFVLGS
jgi:hypothetical protein